jgi:hypothetical protein
VLQHTCVNDTLINSFLDAGIFVALFVSNHLCVLIIYIWIDERPLRESAPDDGRFAPPFAVNQQPRNQVILFLNNLALQKNEIIWIRFVFMQAIQLKRKESVRGVEETIPVDFLQHTQESRLL